MNRAYRSVWNAVTSTWTAAAETAKSQSKGSARAARQAVVAFALGGAAVGGAAAAEACTTEEGTKGTVDAAGVCTVANGGTIGTTGLIGTMAFDDTTYVKVNSTGAAATASGTNAVAIGGSANSGGTDSTAIGQGATVVSGANNSVALGTSARVTNSNSAAIGSNASVAGSYSNAFGPSATSAGTATIALGGNSTATGNYSVAIGGATTTGRAAVATGTGSIALGTTSSAGATNAVALGFGTVANRDNTVSVGAGVPNIDGSTFTRQIVNVAAGTEDNDAVNVAQMNAGLSTTNASIAATNLAVASLSTGLSTTNSTVAGLSTSLSSTNSTVAGLSTGLSSTNSTVAGLSTGLSSTNSTVAGLSTGLSSTNSTVAGHTKQIGDIDDKLSKLESGTIGLVQQAGAGADLTVGANTDGAAVDFAGKAGDRTLKGIAAGTVSASSDEAVNGSQLHGVADSIASAIGGGSTVNPDGSISAPAFTVGDGSGGTKILNSVGDVVTNLDGRVTNNEGAISKLADEIGSGALGLVQQANTGDDITVGAGADGAAVNFTGTAGARKLTGLANGTVAAGSTDAVTGDQLHATNLDVAKNASDLAGLGSQVTGIDGRVTVNETNIAKNTGDITNINNQLDELSSGTIGLVQQAGAGADLTVGANTDGAAVDFAGKAGDRTLKGVAAGTVSATSNEAVNGSQLHGVADSVASAIGGGSTVNPDGSISAPAFTVGDGSGGTTIVNSIGDVVTNLDGRVTTNEGAITKLAGEIGSGTLGLVQQANVGDDITVGAGTDGAAVNFTGTAGARKLTGLANGTVAAGSTDAVTGDQLHATNQDVAKNASDLANLGSQVTSIDGRVTVNETNIAKNTGDITNIHNQLDELSSGTIGLVQQAGAGADLTVGANTDGAAVDFAGKAGDRTLKGVAAGTVSATSNETVNGSQLHGVADSVASAIGGGSTVNPDGSISAPAFTVGDGSGGTKIVNSVGDVVTNLDGRVTNNETSITQIRNDMSSGSVGLVRQDPASGTIMVAAALGGASVNIAGTDGTRRLSGVAKGVDDDDAVTVAQLKATGLIDYTGKEIGAVTYDDGIALDSVTFGGKTGTTLHNIAPGLIAAGSMDGVNGGQLYAMQQDFAKQYGDLSSKVGDLSGRVGDLEAGGGGPGDGSGTPGYGPGMGTGGEGSLVVGGADASGSNGTAVGQGAGASGSNGTALGQGAGASGSNGTAVGQDAIASGENSTALGQGASATGSGSVAIGQGSVATEANTVSFGDGTAEGNRRLVNIADGVNASDAATKGQLDRAMESVDARFNDTNRAINDVAKNAYAGIAAAMAMPNMTPSQPGKTVVAVGAANFKSGSAIAAGATYRSRSGNWLVNGATSITSVGDVGVRAQVGYEF
ncbi:YadA-like family protein [Burkholderia pseudomultivorans]|uniref:YadA-like family protein n=1 Tax=Burkholderia pseudomultivorans TaxID=1207504 RepID=UPI0007C65720|nr:YadA-like family protein [Burkholderia pseudomultivorans]